MQKEIKGKRIILREQREEDASFLPIGLINCKSCSNAALRSLPMRKK